MKGFRADDCFRVGKYKTGKFSSEKEMFVSFAIHMDTDSTVLSRALAKMQKEIIKSDRNIYAD